MGVGVGRVGVSSEAACGMGLGGIVGLGGGGKDVGSAPEAGRDVGADDGAEVKKLHATNNSDSVTTNTVALPRDLHSVIITRPQALC